MLVCVIVNIAVLRTTYMPPKTSTYASATKTSIGMCALYVGTHLNINFNLGHGHSSMEVNHCVLAR